MLDTLRTFTYCQVILPSFNRCYSRLRFITRL